MQEDEISSSNAARRRKYARQRRGRTEAIATRVPVPLPRHVCFPSNKQTQALVLLQAALGGLPLEDWTLRGEQSTMLEAAARLLGCCAESLAVAGRGGGLGCAVSLRLMRSVRLKMWMDTEVKESTVFLSFCSSPWWYSLHQPSQGGGKVAYRGLLKTRHTSSPPARVGQNRQLF